MTTKQFKSEFKITDYKYDPWGCAMEAFFECAGRMNKRGMDIPYEWHYRPGMGSDGTDKDNYWYSLFARCSNKQLAAIGNLLHRYTSLIALAGKSY
jgi:hypothetical protein